jgi:hypothetical protein
VRLAAGTVGIRTATKRVLEPTVAPSPATGSPGAGLLAKQATSPKVPLAFRPVAADLSLCFFSRW